MGEGGNARGRFARCARASEIQLGLATGAARYDDRNAGGLSRSRGWAGYLQEYRDSAGTCGRQMGDGDRHEAFGAFGGASRSVFRGSERARSSASATGRGAGLQRHDGRRGEPASGRLGRGGATAFLSGWAGARGSEGLRPGDSVSLPSDGEGGGGEIRDRALLREKAAGAAHGGGAIAAGLLAVFGPRYSARRQGLRDSG